MTAPNYAPELNTQKSLIYDLRSELSNLKNQFSRLITKPPDPAARTKPPPVLGSRTRYANEGEPAGQVDRGYTATPDQLRKEGDYGGRHISRNGVTRWSRRDGQSPRHSEYYPMESQNRGGFEVNNQQIRAAQHSTYIRINNGNGISQELSPATKFSTKNQASLSGQFQSVREAEQDRKKQEGETVKEKYQKMISELNLKLAGKQKQLDEANSRNAAKDQRIRMLEDNIREQSQISNKTNQFVVEIEKQKNRQIQNLRQSHANQLKSCQIQLQKRSNAERAALQSKHESMLVSLKDMYERRLQDVVSEKQRIRGVEQQQRHEIRALQTEIKQKQKQQVQLISNYTVTKQQLTKKIQIVNSLLLKQAQLTKTKQAEAKPKQLKQTATSCDLRVQTSTSINTKHTENQEVGKLHEKINIYLSNIDKQAQKIKQQKGELDRVNKNVEDLTKIINDKETIVRNVVRDCKGYEKDLIEARRSRKEATELLENCNEALMRSHAGRLNKRYQKL